MADKTYALLDLAAVPAVGATLFDPRPALLFRGDGRGLIFANPAAIDFLGEPSLPALLSRTFPRPLSRRLSRMAKGDRQDPCLEMLPLTVGRTELALAATFARVELTDGDKAVLAIGAVGAGHEPLGLRADRLVDRLATADAIVAVLRPDGRILGASGGLVDLAAAVDDVEDLVAASVESATPMHRPISTGATSREARAVRFKAGDETLVLLSIAANEVMAALPREAPAATALPAPAPNEAAPASPAAEAVQPSLAESAMPEASEPGMKSEPLAFSEDDIDVAARKSIEEGRTAAAPGDEPPIDVPEVRRQAVGESPAPPALRSNVVRLPGAPVRAFPPERLSGTEQDAFRRIAEELGVRMNEEPRPDERVARAAPSIVQPAGGPEARLLEKLLVGIAVYRDRSTLFANRALLDLLGYDSFADFAAAGGVEAILPAGAAARPATGNKGEVSARKRDGSAVAVEARLHSITFADQPAAMLSLLKRGGEPRRDPLPDRRFMADLAASGDRVEELEAILDTATDGVVVIDHDGKIDSFNRSAEALFGVTANEVVGQPFVELFADESRKAAHDYLDGLSANGVASVLNDGREVIGKVPKGGMIPLFMTIGRISGGEKFCAVLRDITHWKNVEGELVAARRSAESASAQKSEFLAKISHEIRTPLNAIIGFSEVMMQERFGTIGNERYRAYLRDINVSGAHLMSLINDLLDLSKIEAGKVELSFESVELNDVIQESVALMQPQANRERIIIRTSLSTGVPHVVADPRSLRQILLNLLSNAIKFTQAGGQVIVATALEESGEVELRIRDTGVGMSEKDLELAMKPFRQGGAGRDRNEGTGLGLPLTKALVEANRATFVISSAPNQGTLVKITFPTTRVLAG